MPMENQSNDAAAGAQAGTSGGSFVTQQAQNSTLLSGMENQVTQQSGGQPSPPAPLPEGEGNKTEAGQAAAANQAPENYQAFNLPEGMDTNDPQAQAMLTEASGVFREMGLSQEQAQKLVDLHVKNLKPWIGAQEAYEQELTRRVAQWEEQVRTHPEFGGVRLDENLTTARRAIANLGGDALMKALNETGAGGHPEIFAAFVRAGRLFREDSFVDVTGNGAGTSAANTPEAKARLVYPDMRHS